jgi:hypothetical protein
MHRDEAIAVFHLDPERKVMRAGEKKGEAGDARPRVNPS